MHRTVHTLLPKVCTVLCLVLCTLLCTVLLIAITICPAHDIARVIAQ